MNGEVLGEDEHQTTVDGAAASDHTITRKLLFLHAEVVATVFLEHIVLFERTFVQQHIYALAGSVFPALMLLLNSFLTTTETRLFAFLDKLLDFL